MTRLKEQEYGTDNFKSEEIDVICDVLCVSPQELRDITILKKGMTNRSKVA